MEWYTMTPRERNLTEIEAIAKEHRFTLQELVWQTECDHSDDEADYRYEEMRSRELLEGL